MPPLVMGFVYGRRGSNGLGLALLAAVTTLTLIVVELTTSRRGPVPVS
ncbi:hypothetical protein ACIBI9_57540 [Nonomuraea sp. NPDC050451]